MSLESLVSIKRATGSVRVGDTGKTRRRDDDRRRVKLRAYRLLLQSLWLRKVLIVSLVGRFHDSVSSLNANICLFVYLFEQELA